MALNKVIIALLLLCSAAAFAQQQGNTPGTVQHFICDSGCSGGAGGGGVAQLQVRNAGDTAWVNVGINGADLSVPVVLQAGAAVIGHVIVDTAPITPVTGTFWPYTLGQQLAAASVPVVLTASQITTLTPPAAITNFANETGGNLATIATRTPALGQALAASSVPVVLTAAQLTTLTPLSSISVSNFPGTQAVSIATLPALTAGSAVIGHVINNASAAIIGHIIVDTAPSTAVTNAGTFATQATLAAETTKVIGTINVAAAQTIGLAAGSAVIGHVINDASSAVIGHVIADSGSTTAVTQATGTNLHTVVDSGAITATLAAETTKVIGTARILGNTGATLDAAPGAALPTNVQAIAGRDSTQTGGGAAVPVVCDKSAVITAGAAATTIVIALAASKTTYICGFVVTGAGAAGTMQWKSGTGTTCGTGTANLTGAMATGIGVAVSYGNGFGTIMRHASAAQDTCITMATASATAAGIVSYAQF